LTHQNGSPSWSGLHGDLSLCRCADEQGDAKQVSVVAANRNIRLSVHAPYFYQPERAGSGEDTGQPAAG